MSRHRMRRVDRFILREAEKPQVQSRLCCHSGQERHRQGARGPHKRQCQDEEEPADEQPSPPWHRLSRGQMMPGDGQPRTNRGKNTSTDSGRQHAADRFRSDAARDGSAAGPRHGCPIMKHGRTRGPGGSRIGSSTGPASSSSIMRRPYPAESGRDSRTLVWSGRGSGRPDQIGSRIMRISSRASTEAGLSVGSQRAISGARLTLSQPTSSPSTVAVRRPPVAGASTWPIRSTSRLGRGRLRTCPMTNGIVHLRPVDPPRVRVGFRGPGGAASPDHLQQPLGRRQGTAAARGRDGTSVRSGSERRSALGRVDRIRCAAGW